jgi:hypothetical protein
MLVTFGKFKNTPIDLLVLKQPDYIDWMLKLINAEGPMVHVISEVKRLISIFDAKPIIKCCTSRECGKVATRGSLYHNDASPMWWCDDCNPYRTGAIAGKLEIVGTYQQALDYVNMYCSARKSDKRTIIKSFAEAKGLPSRVGKKQASEFFHIIDCNNFDSD